MTLDRLTEQSRTLSRSRHVRDQALPGLTILCQEQVSEIDGTLYEPVLCLVLQGRKETSIGEQSADLGPGDALLVSHDLPVMSRITKASRQEPYLAVILAIDMGIIRGLHDQVGDADPLEAEGRSLAVGRAEPPLVGALERYLDLVDDPLDARVVGPMILREIHYRLLLSPAGRMLRRLLIPDSHASRIAKAITCLRRDLQAPLAIPELAKTAGMSETSFHQHFKAVTGTTPLQYRKTLRLISARTLLTEAGQSVARAAYAVGYESPAHFSRDFSRTFGAPPVTSRSRA